jgi:lysyl-tRNA synthetase class 2
MALSPWWCPDRHADRKPFLDGRTRVRAACRRYFAEHGFTEVEAAILQLSPGNETHLHAFETGMETPGHAAMPLYLRTSPEFACKKLLAGGETLIVDFARSFRNRERGPLHHPEFTLLEWYRARAPYQTVMEDCLALLAAAAQATGTRQFAFRDRTADPFADAERITVAEAFARHAGIDLLATVTGRAGDRDKLAGKAQAAGVAFAADDDWSDIFSHVLIERVEPQLGRGRATILSEYPAIEAALAQPCAADARVAERFEIFICGVELANGFGELTDAAEQRRRFEHDMAEKERRYGLRYPIDEDFLAALAHMPPASGVALGFDRLVMLATGATHIEQVIWTPLPDPSEP